ncbi:MAG: hypothetical protein K9K40_02500 [Desulfotignum sp.]|nr:hypothetical protein [Desulfotignum sp.]MCF8125212.1 hypothetical protein [Desulfotignum sp.]
MDPNHGVPPESIFGSFDLVLCRNLLIYFNSRYQETIFAKLYQALVPGGTLILGQAEAPPPPFQHHFTRMVNFCPIYIKK